MQSRESLNNQKIILDVAIVDSMNLTAIFTLFLKETFAKFLEEIGKFFMFPLAAMAGCIQAVLAWRQAGLDDGKASSIGRAVVETASAIAITTAVIGGLVGATTFALAAPIIFTATLAAKAVYHIGLSIYHFYQSAKAWAKNDVAGHASHLAAARANAIAATALILATVAVSLVMLAGKTAFAVFGVISGVIGTGYAIYNRFFASKTKTPTQEIAKPLLQDDQAGLSDAARIQQRLTAQPGHRPTIQPANPITRSLAARESVSVRGFGHFRQEPTLPASDVTAAQTGVKRSRSFGFA